LHGLHNNHCQQQNNMATAIEFNNISKIYRLGLVSTGTLSHDLKRWWTMNILHQEDPYLTIGETNDRSSKGDSDYVWALRDIDFKVEQGDVVGIIGKNGAGKSTLLKILSRVTAPTTGTIRARGRIGSLLEVGTGFHPEMTGRENIYMNGAILGMTKQEITRKLDEIVDFSGCERYIDTPVKRYSSGMMVRLGFAVAAHLDPEILVVDEVLAVGDAEFQKKAIGKMQDVSKGEGRTVLFVSHNMTAVKNLCKRGVLLENGTMADTGNIDYIVETYLNKNKPKLGYDLTQYDSFTGKGILRCGKVEIHSSNEPNGIIVNNKPASVQIEIINEKHATGKLEVALVFRNGEHTYVNYSGNRLTRQQFDIPQVNSFTVEVDYDELPFSPGNYTMGIEIMIDKELVWWGEEVISFHVEEIDYYGTGDQWSKGVMVLKQNWRLL